MVPDEDEPLALAAAILDRSGFDAEQSILTRPQAEVLVLRERGFTQRAIADARKTSRANISNIEATARENLQKARETVAFADTVQAAVRIEIESGTELIEIPERVYSTCDREGMKVAASAPELLKVITEGASGFVEDGRLEAPLLIAVGPDGEVTLRPIDEA